MGPGAGVHGGEIVAQGTPADILRHPDSLTGQYLSGRKAIPMPARRRRGDPTQAQLRIAGARGNNLKNVTVELPVGLFVARHRRLGLGQVHAHQRHALQRGRAPPLRLGRRARRARRDRGPRLLRQGDQRRPEPDRAHAALQPGDVHGTLHADPRPLRRRARVARARLRPGALLLQREGRALRGVPGRRPDQGRDALPARRLRALRRLPRQALQPRDARGALQGHARSTRCST